MPSKTPDMYDSMDHAHFLFPSDYTHQCTRVVAVSRQGGIV